MAYSSTEDLLHGNIPLQQAIDPGKYVDEASDEVDSAIGFRYETPIDVSDTSEVSRPARLLLKRVANHIATGRILMAAAAGSQDKSLHAYAKMLLDEASSILKQIAEGAIILPGADQSEDTSPASTGPLIYNKDIESNVDAFYDRIAAPDENLVRVAIPYTLLLEG